MKIQIKEAGGKSLTIPLPNAMLFSPTVVKLVLRFSSHRDHDEMPQFPSEVVDGICAAIKNYTRKHGPWELVHVESSGGDIVIITI